MPNNAINDDKQKQAEIDDIFGGPEPPAPVVSAPDNQGNAQEPGATDAMVSPRQNVQSTAPPVPGRSNTDDDGGAVPEDSRRS